jgi:crotonobetainyl-CoA:carnitine CoA-transferase CaiB-like acyl-CoA transferase
MVEAALNAAAPALIAYQVTGELPGRRGNRSASGAAPRGVFKCAGSDQWVAIEIATDDQWAALCTVVGDPPPVGDDLAGAAARRTHEDTLEDWLHRVTIGWDTAALAQRLTEAGVPAAVVITPPEVAANPQVRHRGLFEPEDHPVTGQHDLPGLPFSMDRIGSWVRRAAPVLGQHNDEVFDELGVDAAARQALRRLNIIGEDLVRA